MRNNKAITLISLVITIIILVILSSIGIYLAIGNNGLVPKAQEAEQKTTKEVATEKMNLKITNRQIEIYTKEERMPTLQEFADGLCEDDEIEYVELKSKKKASLDKISVGENESIYTKLKEYPYEFEIDSSLRLASINGIKVATADSGKTNSTWKKYMMNENGYVSGGTNITLPEQFEDLYIKVNMSDTCYSYNIPYISLTDTIQAYMQGFGIGGLNNYCRLDLSKTELTVTEAWINGVDTIDILTVEVYYK